MAILEDNKIELWDLYDKYRVKLDKTHQRGVPLEKGEYHMVVHVCIFNSNNEMLIQQRQSYKHGWPGMWDVTVGGSSLVGELSYQAAERETKEEIGYEIDLSEERPYFTMNFQYGFDDFYLIKKDLDINELILQEEEVQAVKWAGKEEILQMVQEGTFIPYYFLDILFDMKEHRGALRHG